MKTEKPLEQQIAEAKAHALTVVSMSIRAVSAPVGSYTLVTSEQDATITYAITRDPEGKLTCSCPARVVCKHIGLVLLTGIAYHVPPMGEVRAARVAAFRRIATWLASLEAPGTQEREASKALTLAEHSERSLAGQTFSQEERLRALAYLPVVIAAYVVVMGPAHAWQWHQAKEEQWERYQAARLGNFLCG